MNPKSISLLSCLRTNSREKLTNISKKTGIPISTLFEMLKEVQGQVITKSTVLLDFSSLGYHTHAYVFLKIGENDKEKFRQYLICAEDVNSLYKINNGWDFVLETVHKNIKELDGFLEGISKKFNIENKKIHYLVDEVKKEGFMIP